MIRVFLAFSLLVSFTSLSVFAECIDRNKVDAVLDLQEQAGVQGKYCPVSSNCEVESFYQLYAPMSLEIKKDGFWTYPYELKSSYSSNLISCRGSVAGLFLSRTPYGIDTDVTFASDEQCREVVAKLIANKKLSLGLKYGFKEGFSSFKVANVCEEN